MIFADNILKAAADDDFHKDPSGPYLGALVLDELYSLSQQANAVFGGMLSGEKELIMDVHEPLHGSPLRVRDAFTFAVNLIPTPMEGYEWTARHLKVKEQGLRLRFFNDGKVECTTAARPFDDSGRKLRPLRQETFNAANLNRLEEFLASWVRGNLSARAIIAIQDRIQRQADSEPGLDEFQLKRLKQAEQRLGLKFS